MVEQRGTPAEQIDQALHALVSACARPIGANSTPPQPNGRIVDLAEAREKRQAPPQVVPEARSRAGLPARIVVADRALASAVRALCEPLGIKVEQATRTATFESAITALSEFLDATMPDGEEFAWEVDLTRLRALCKAVTGYYRRAPWEYMPDTPPLQIHLGASAPEPGVETLYASILGAAGLVGGVAFYYTLADVVAAMRGGADLEPAGDEDVAAMVDLLKQSGVPTDQIPQEALHRIVGSALEAPDRGADQDATDLAEIAQNSLAVLFASEEEAGASYVEWLKQRDVKPPARDSLPMFVRTEVGQLPRHPSDNEVAAMTLALEAINQFFTRYKSALAGPFLPPDPLSLIAQIGSGADKRAIEVIFPPPDWDEAVEFGGEEALEEPAQPATEAGARTVYHFLVTLDVDDEEIWRRFELRGDQTLHHLHLAIQDAFEWDDDHEYAFYLSGDYWDEATAYQRPGSGDRSAARFRLEHLPIRRGQRFVYLFDFGDEWRHEIKLEEIEKESVQAGVTYPRLTEQYGASPAQYPDLEDEFDDEDTEDMEGDDDTE
jgi:hypothetical protein